MVVLSIALIASITEAGAQSTLLGILEELPGAYVGDPKFRAVRVVFEKRGNDWRAFPSDCPDEVCLKTIASQYPTEVTWTVTFSGHNLGRIAGHTPDGFKSYSYMGLQQIITRGPFQPYARDWRRMTALLKWLYIGHL